MVQSVTEHEKTVDKHESADDTDQKRKPHKCVDSTEQWNNTLKLAQKSLEAEKKRKNDNDSAETAKQQPNNERAKNENSKRSHAPSLSTATNTTRLVRLIVGKIPPTRRKMVAKPVAPKIWSKSVILKNSKSM